MDCGIALHLIIPKDFISPILMNLCFLYFLKTILKYLNGKLDSKVEYVVTFIYDLEGIR